MPEELQGLLERIHNEGVKKAEDERQAILEKAKAEAAAMLKQAKEDAEKLKKSAFEEAARDREKAEAAIRQAARDISIALEAELNARLNACVKRQTGEAMTPELMAEIIRETLKTFVGAPAEAKLELMLPKAKLDALRDRLLAALKQDVRERPEFFAGADFTSGVKVGFKGEDVFFDFSDDALTELIMTYVSPRLAEILRPQTADKKS